ncbi:hypothetical protein WICMUC_002258 [Wickerhamomyces mucosus]|uniref:Endoplasmic oxidoreductin n=1 Tax=Wickerhamomyces mucosus TaxID=1378264 RepID=A0A9P8PPM8_9ASCO|nr:hypothetical protein WICMUC_002258 [Wickerhamomyces mucosus]
MILSRYLLTLISILSSSSNFITCSISNDDFLFNNLINTNDLIKDQCCDLTYKDINILNGKIRSKVHDLVNEDYFKHYQFQLDMECPFFECQSICFSPGCQLDLDVHSDSYNYDDNNGDIDNNQNLGNLNQDSFLDDLCFKDNNNSNDLENWCDLIDNKGVIIDISKNPERFTGYLPTPERNIWGMIYQNQLEGECKIEQEVFYDIISGFHSSVSTHLSNEYFNNETNNWEPNLNLFKFKVGNHSERISNIYFNYSILLKSIFKIYPYLQKYQLNQFAPSNDLILKKKIKSLINEFPNNYKIFDENLMFTSNLIKDEFKLKFKNVTRLMDCVTCDRCRLWGKIQSTGYATALKILFDDNNPKLLQNLQKIEIQSLFNTFDRLTKSIESIQKFNELDNNLEDINLNLDLDDSNDSFKDKFNQELLEVWNALKFIFQSYIDLPYNLKNLILIKFHSIWNEFIGIKSDKELLHRII